MALFTRSSASVSKASQEVRAGGCRSLGFKALIDALDPERSYSILDLGSAIGPNIEFLTQISSRIRVGDLYATLKELKFFERVDDEPPDPAVIERALSLAGHESFDIVLSWDLVNYLTTDEFRSLIRCLEPHCAAGSFFFAIGSTLKEMPASPMTFRIQDSETLIYCTESSDTRPCPRYAPRDLGLIMGGFRRHSSYMLRNGMQEYLFVRE